MLREVLIHSPLLGLPLAALVLFVVLFAGIVFRVLRRGPGAYESTALLPLASECASGSTARALAVVERRRS